MARKFLVSTSYSIIVFCLVSYASVMISLLNRTGTDKPVTNIGFPYKYYYQFWTSGSNEPNWGWRLDNLVLDFVLTWLVTTFFILLVRKVNR